jgi:hypothetical protein
VAPSEEREADNAHLDFVPPPVSVPVGTGGLALTFLNDFVLDKGSSSVLLSDPSADGAFIGASSGEREAADEVLHFIPSGISVPV